VKRAKGIEERTDNKLVGTAHRDHSEDLGYTPLNENLTVRIMSKPQSAVNAFLRIMRIFFTGHSNDVFCIHRNRDLQ
jgi:hypothetical protein